MAEKKDNRKIVALSDNFFIYTDDPIKVMYRKADKSFNWIRFCSNDEAVNFHELEKDLIKETRDLYNAGTPDYQTMVDLIAQSFPKVNQYAKEDGDQEGEGAINQETLGGQKDNQEGKDGHENRALATTDRKKSTTIKPSDRPVLMAKLNGIPEELANSFFAIIDNNLYIKAPGLLFMAGKIGYSRIKVESYQDDVGKGWRATAYVYPRIPKEVMVSFNGMDKEIVKRVLDDYYGATIGYGSANDKNLKDKQKPFAREMAETRAVVRALRLYTGYGGTAFEELPQGEPTLTEQKDLEGESQYYGEHYQDIKRD